MPYMPIEESNQGWNRAMVALAVVASCVGVASLAQLSAPATQLYAPVAVRPVTSTLTAPVARYSRAAPTQQQFAAVQPEQFEEQVYETVAPAAAAQSTVSVGPLAGLLAIPLGLAAFMMRRPAAAQADEETGFSPAAAAAGFMAAGAAAPAFAQTQEVAQVAADGRLAAVAGVLVPAVGWVGFNVLSAATRQLSEMQDVADSRAPTNTRSARAAPKRAPKRR